MSAERSHPAAEILADYWLAVLPAKAEESVEEHLLACDSCGDRLREIVALVAGVRRLARDGTLRLVVSKAFVARLATQGRRVREYAPPNGGSVDCTVTADDDFLLARLAAELNDAKRVDLALCDAAGAELMRLADIPADARTGEVLYQESIAFARSLPTGTLIARLLSVNTAGAERTLGEYAFRHTRSPSLD